MLKQLNLWPTQEEPPQPPEIWHHLDQQLKNQVITALASLIRKMVCSKKTAPLTSSDRQLSMFGNQPLPTKLVV